MGEIYELQELEWSDTLHQDLYEMMTKDRFCDTEILTGDGQTLNAHANILSARSQLLKHTFQVSSTSSFKLSTENIPASLWKTILHFMYLGKASIEKASLQDLFDAAEALEMAKLQELCKLHLKQVEAEQIEAKQSNMASIETQTEEEIMQFASGEKSTLYGYDEGDVHAGLEVDTSAGHSETSTAQSSLPSVSYTVDELELPEQEGTLYLMETDDNNKPYIAVAGPVNHQSGSDSTQPTISITKNSSGSTPSRANNQSVTKSKALGNRVLQKDMLFKCGICNKFFSSKQGLERHAILHSNVKGYTCEVCGKSFKVERYLQAHVERHNVERSFQCPICGKGFKTQRDATWHRKTVHTNEKKFQCPHCNYAGKTKNLLNQHMFSHTNAKHFICRTCGKTFLRKQHLMQHAERHEGKRKFMCSTCGAEFYTIYACKEHHMRIHQGVKKYECSVCGQQYNEKKSFMKHLQKHSVDLVLKLEGDIVVEQTVKQEAIVGEQYSEVETTPLTVDNITAGTQYAIVQYQQNQDSAQDVELHYVQDGSIVEGQYIEEAVGQ